MWGDIDVLLIDTPPGTSDEHITVAQLLTQQQFDGAVLVTTPQNVSVGDVRREITFCNKVGFTILGLFENMSGFVCPHCSECFYFYFYSHFYFFIFIFIFIFIFYIFLFLFDYFLFIFLSFIFYFYFLFLFF